MHAVITQPPTIDLAVLTRDERPLAPAVTESIRRVRGVMREEHAVAHCRTLAEPDRRQVGALEGWRVAHAREGGDRGRKVDVGAERVGR